MNRPTDPEWYVPCGVPAGFHRYEGLCIRPEDHDGPHNGHVGATTEATR